MQFFENGFEIVNHFISSEWHSKILQDIETSELSTDVSGIRLVNTKLRSVNEYIQSKELSKALGPFVPEGSTLVRAILFNKSAAANWYVTWHQDKTVAVSEVFEGNGWGVWSQKEGVLHAQPPVELLNSMVTVRIHLDSTPKENGCLKVIPNSHKLGILTPEQINSIVASETPVFCEAPKYSALIMRPHILHASSKSEIPSNRRILHLEFSNWVLPNGITWS